MLIKIIDGTKVAYYDLKNYVVSGSLISPGIYLVVFDCVGSETAETVTYDLPTAEWNLLKGFIEAGLVLSPIRTATFGIVSSTAPNQFTFAADPGWPAGLVFTVSGTVGNDGDYTIVGNVGAVYTVVEAVVNGGAAGNADSPPQIDGYK